MPFIRTSISAFYFLQSLFDIFLSISLYFCVFFSYGFHTCIPVFDFPQSLFNLFLSASLRFAFHFFSYSPSSTDSFSLDFPYFFYSLLSSILAFQCLISPLSPFNLFLSASLYFSSISSVFHPYILAFLLALQYLIFLSFHLTYFFLFPCTSLPFPRFSILTFLHFPISLMQYFTFFHIVYFSLLSLLSINAIIQFPSYSLLFYPLPFLPSVSLPYLVSLQSCISLFPDVVFHLSHSLHLSSSLPPVYLPILCPSNSLSRLHSLMQYFTLVLSPLPPIYVIFHLSYSLLLSSSLPPVYLPILSYSLFLFSSLPLVCLPILCPSNPASFPPSPFQRLFSFSLLLIPVLLLYCEMLCTSLYCLSNQTSTPLC